MKKTVCALLALFMLTALAGCGDNGGAKIQNSSGNSVSAVLQQQMNQSDAEQPDETQPSVRQENSSGKTAAASSDVDVDLTKLSSTMVYSEVYNMMTMPDDYIGKTVRMNGQFSLYQATDANGAFIPDQIYYACVIADATACCQQGMEFILAGDASYPEDYPKLGENITIVGEFQTYMEGQYMYCHLVNAAMEQ